MRQEARAPQSLSMARFVMLVGVSAVLFFLALLPLEALPEIPVDIDSKPFFIPLVLCALLPAGRPGLAIALGVALGEGLRDLMEGYELDDPFGFVGYVVAFWAASFVFTLGPRNALVLILGATVCGVIQSAFEALSFLLFGDESLPVVLQSGIGNTISHGILWGALPLVFLVPALHGRFERTLGFAPKGAEPPDGPLVAGDSRLDPAERERAAAWAEGLAFRYPGTREPALSDVALTLRKGEVLALIGPSGAGKSTLCRVLAGLAPRASGGEVAGEVGVADLDPVTAPGRDISLTIGLVGHNAAAQFTQSKALEEVAATLLAQGIEREEAHRRARAALERVGMPEARDHVRSWELTDGEQRRVLLAAALVSDPRLLILDETTDGMSGREAAIVEDLLNAPGPDGATLIVDNDLDRVLAWADRAAVMREGRILAEGPASEVLADREVLGQVGFAPPLALAEAGDAPADDNGRTGARSALADASGSGAGKARDSDGPVLSFENVTFGYDKAEAPLIEDASFELARGEVLAVAGANGAGKTTLARLAAGLKRPRAGAIYLTGKDVTRLPARKRLQRIATAMHQPAAFLSKRTVLREIAFPLVKADRPRKKAEKQAAATAERLDLTALLDRDPLILAPGQAKRVQIATVLARGAPAIVLDEPARGLDPRERADILDLIRTLAAEGAGVLLLDHDTDFIAEAADRVLILDGRRLDDAGAPRDAFAPARWTALAEAGLAPPKAAEAARDAGVAAVSRSGYLRALAGEAA